MGAYKDLLIGVEELIYSALEKGFTDTDGVYAYVYMYEPRVDRFTVESILLSMTGDEEMYRLEP